MKEDKMDKRGERLQHSWNELRKAGGLSPPPEQIRAMLIQDEKRMLTRSELVDLITGYFQSCMTVTTNENGEEVFIWAKNPTKSGLAVWLGLSPQTLIDYVNGSRSDGKKFNENHPDAKRRISTADFDLLRKAYTLLTDFYEAKLGQNMNNSGSIFWLLNGTSGGWSNETRTIVEHRKNLTPLDASELPDLGQRIFVPAKDVTNETIERYLIPQIKSDISSDSIQQEGDNRNASKTHTD